MEADIHTVCQGEEACLDCVLATVDQYMVIRNYAKQTDGLFARIIGKISALTVAQYINYLNNQPIGRVKYALV